MSMKVADLMQVRKVGRTGSIGAADQHEAGQRGEQDAKHVVDQDYAPDPDAR